MLCHVLYNFWTIHSGSRGLKKIKWAVKFKMTENFIKANQSWAPNFHKKTARILSQRSLGGERRVNTQPTENGWVQVPDKTFGNRL